MREALARAARRVTPAGGRRPLGIALLATALLGMGPCGPIAGGRLPGPDATPPNDWSIANDAEAVPRCAVEVRPDAPHSVTVNCMSWQGRLFVSCSECAPKRWSGFALDDPRGRVRVGESVYPVAFSRVVVPAELDAVWEARARKLGKEPGPRPIEWWTF